MSFENWQDVMSGLGSRLASLPRDDDHGGLRQALAEVWHSIKAAPSTVLHLYKQISEAEIQVAAASIGIKTGRTDFGLPTLAVDVGATDLLKQAVAILRALETEFRHLHVDGRKPQDPNFDWLVHHPSGDLFLIPVPRLAWKDIKPQEDKRSFNQRALLYIRLIPAAIDGSPVKIHFPDLSGPDLGLLNFGGSLFTGVQFKEKVVQGPNPGFLVTEAKGEDLAGETMAALEKAHLDGCFCLVFPELTVDDNLLDQVSAALAAKPWASGEDLRSVQAPAFVVAGSWHRQANASHANVAKVLSGDGEHLLDYHKRYAAENADGIAEAITPGASHDILVTGRGIFAFGICLDFCQEHFEHPYTSLNVDFVVVPSCGNDTTMNGHIKTAVKLHQQRHTRSFVVQQFHTYVPGLVDDTECLGYYLPPDGAPSQQTLKTVRSVDNWRVFAAAT